MREHYNINNVLYARQCGAALVEFAIVAAAFFTLLLGTVEMGRVLFTWNSAAEATRLGARLAVVCDLGDLDIKRRMRTFVPALSDDLINISYEPSGCTSSTCEMVTVSIAPGFTVTPLIPFLSLSLTLPSFSTTLVREIMQSVVAGEVNPVCT